MAKRASVTLLAPEDSNDRSDSGVGLRTATDRPPQEGKIFSIKAGRRSYITALITQLNSVT